MTHPQNSRKPKTCKANIGSRKEPIECGRPLADGMLAACSDHKTTMIRTSTPAVYYRGRSYVVVSKHRGQLYKTYHRTMAEAKEAHGDRTGSQKVKPQNGRPFDEYAREWLAAYQGRTRRGFDETTRKAYEFALETYIIPHFRSMPLRDIDRGDVNALITKLGKRGLSAGAVEKYLAPLRSLFSSAVDDGLLRTNPALRLTINAKVGGKPRKTRALTPDQLDALVAQVPECHRLLIEVIAGTGCRVSEALGLDMTDMSKDGDGTVSVTFQRQWYRGEMKDHLKSENGKRTVRLSPELGRRLYEYGADRVGPMFTTRTGRRLSDRNLNRELKQAAERAMIGHVSLHTLRHSHGTLLHEQGFTNGELADRLGDDEETIFRTYVHKRDTGRSLAFLDR